MINDNEGNMVEGFETNKYGKLEYNNKTLLHYYKLYRLLDDLGDHYRVEERFDYNEKNYMGFFKKYLKNIKITYTKGYMNHINVKRYELI